MRNLFSRMLSSRAIVLSCRLLLAAIFIYAAVGKVLQPSDFADSVAGFRILPVSTVNLFAIVLPWLELICGLSLVTGLFLRSGLALLAGLNIVFIAAAASAMSRGLSVECGCFTLSHADDTVGWSLIARDTGFLLLCLLIALNRPRKNEAVAAVELRTAKGAIRPSKTLPGSPRATTGTKTTTAPRPQ